MIGVWYTLRTLDRKGYSAYNEYRVRRGLSYHIRLSKLYNSVLSAYDVLLQHTKYSPEVLLMPDPNEVLNDRKYS